jgi:hypothetical protein
LWVDLVAEAEEGYCFVSWTGDVSPIGNVDDATTDIVVMGYYSITANFGHACTPVVAAGREHTLGLKKMAG